MKIEGIFHAECAVRKISQATILVVVAEVCYKVCQQKYKQVAKVIHWDGFHIACTYCQHQPENILEKDHIKILRDFAI